MKSRPLLGSVVTLGPLMIAEEWTIPTPSSPATQFVPAPLTQLMSSLTVELKLAANKLPAMLTLTALRAAVSTLTAMSQPVKGCMFAALTWRLKLVPKATAPCWSGLTYTKLPGFTVTVIVTE